MSVEKALFGTCDLVILGEGLRGTQNGCCVNLDEWCPRDGDKVELVMLEYFTTPANTL